MQKSIMYDGFFSLNVPVFGTVCSNTMALPCTKIQNNYLHEEVAPAEQKKPF